MPFVESKKHKKQIVTFWHGECFLDYTKNLPDHCLQVPDHVHKFYAQTVLAFEAKHRLEHRLRKHGLLLPSLF